MILDARTHAPDAKIYASPWSPPASMKEIDRADNAHADSTYHQAPTTMTGGGKLAQRYADARADYIICFLRAYAAHDIHMR
jgi:O-glycosyl hydrolase